MKPGPASCVLPFSALPTPALCTPVYACVRTAGLSRLDEGFHESPFPPALSSRTRCGLYKALGTPLQMLTFLPCETRLATLREPPGGRKDPNITERGRPNVMMAISISLPQSSDSGAFCVIGAQLSIWQRFHQAVHLISELP